MRRRRALTLRLIGLDDYVVREDGQRIGRIRYASERSPGCWPWHANVTQPGSPFGAAASLDDAKARFESAWIAFKERHGPEADAHCQTNCQQLMLALRAIGDPDDYIVLENGQTIGRIRHASDRTPPLWL